MVQKQKVRLLLVGALFFVSLGGWMLHIRMHPPLKQAVHLVPFLAGLLSITAIPLMFLFRKTVAYAYVMNGMLVIIGAITMTHFSFAYLPGYISFGTITLNTSLSDIGILFTNFMLGKALFELEMLKGEDTRVRHGRFYRYPNMGWWLVHLVALSAVYLLGHLLWK